MTDKFDTQQVVAFLRRTGEELRKTGEELRDEAQRLLAEVRDPANQQRVRESLTDLGTWFRRTTGEATDRIEHAVKKAEDSQDRLDADDLYVETAFINEGPRLKRIRPAPMGRAYRYQRRTAHITIELGEKK